MPSYKIIQPLMQPGSGRFSRWFSYIGLGVGVLLLLVSLQMYFNIQQLLGGNVIRKNGFDYISITKSVTNESMGHPDQNLFTEQEIAELKSKSFFNGVAPLISNQFRVQLSAGAVIAFKTDLFLESLENDYIDTVPSTFQWHVGQTFVPVIISSDFLEVYNVFAPGQGLPQVSQTTATRIPLQIDCSGNGLQASFGGNVVAFSDRINSVLVPREFLDWANKTFGNNNNHPNTYSRLYIKTKDANDPQLLSYLDQKNYKVNKDKTKFGRMKQVIEMVISGLGIFGLLVVLMALMLFSFYLQLLIARSKDNLQLLLQLGYSPNWLSSKVTRQFLPVYIIVILSALAAVQLVQFLFYQLVVASRPELSPLIHWSVLIIAFVLIFLSGIVNRSIVKRLLYKLD
jgi:Predicted permease.